MILIILTNTNTWQFNLSLKCLSKLHKKICILVLFLTFFFLTQTTKAKQAKNLYYHILQTIMGIYKKEKNTFLENRIIFFR